MHLSWGLSWKGKVRVWQVFSRHNCSHAGEQDQKHFPLRGNKLLFCHLVEKTAIKEFITLPLFGLFSISCTVPFSDGVIYIVTGPLSEGFMPVVWISKLVILLTKEDMSLTVLYYCIFNCAHRWTSQFQNCLQVINFHLSYIAVSRSGCLSKFYPENKALSKTRHYNLNIVHAEYNRTSITWTQITRIPANSKQISFPLIKISLKFTQITQIPH